MYIQKLILPIFAPILIIILVTSVMINPLQLAFIKRRGERNLS